MPIPPILHNKWTHRVMFDPDAPHPHVESFFIKANDPKHDRALWLRLTLFSDGKESFAETWAILFDRRRGRHLAAKERYPLKQVNFDPERPGIGIGTAAIEDGTTHGVVRGDGFTISWRLKLDDQLPEYHPFPSERLYKSKLVASKTVTPHPSALVSGKIEIWDGSSRHAESEVISVEGWHGMQGHNWGKRHTEDYAWAQCSTFEGVSEPAFFEAFSARTKLAGILSHDVLLGRLVVGDKQYRFDTWKNLRVGGKSSHSPTQWKFEVSGPDGKLTGELEGKKEDVVALAYQNPNAKAQHILNTKLASLTLTLEPKDGEKRVLKSGRAALEITAADNHGIPVVL